jgi:SPOR domain
MEEQHHDDQSHYEISLTAGQAFVAFVLLLLSLAASFAFGLMLGKGQADERLVVQKETPVVTEAALIPKKSEGKIVELGVDNDDFAAEAAPAEAAAASDTAPVIEEAPAETTTTASGSTATVAAEAVPAPPATPAVPHLAQLLSTSDQKTAEGLAAKLIDSGFTSAYVERGAATEKGPVYRVRVKFASESEARAAEPKLREFSRDVWITAR